MTAGTSRSFYLAYLTSLFKRKSSYSSTEALPLTRDLFATAKFLVPMGTSSRRPKRNVMNKLSGVSPSVRHLSRLFF